MDLLREKQRALGHHRAQVAAAIVGAAVIGGVASNAAAKKQAGSAGDATELQQYIYNDQKAMHQPWLEAGNAGLNKLSFLMGLSSNRFGGGGSGSGGLETADQIRARLSGKFTTVTPGAQTPPGGGAEGGTPGAYGPDTVTVDEARLDAAVQAEMARQQQVLKQQQRLTARGERGDSDYGSLLREFSTQDFKEDPGYQFRLEQGQNALDRRLAAAGQFYSGRSLKDSMKYNSGMAAQEYGAAFDRFNVGKTNQFNRLASISGIGQTAANQTGAAGQNYANQAGANMIGAGNAQAAGIVGGANAITGAIGQGVSAYQQNQMMNRWQPYSGASNAGSYQPEGGDYGQYL